MTEDQMYEHIRVQARLNVPAIEALANTLTKCGTELKPFLKGEKNLYVRCDNIPFRSIETIGFLCKANFLELSIVAFAKPIEGLEFTFPTPYIHIKPVTNEKVK